MKKIPNGLIYFLYLVVNINPTIANKSKIWDLVKFNLKDFNKEETLMKWK